MKIRVQNYFILPLGLVLFSLAGCGGMTIRNTSDHDVSFSQQVTGGSTTYTLHPGASMELGYGSVVRMQDFTIVDK